MLYVYIWVRFCGGVLKKYHRQVYLASRNEGGADEVSRISLTTRADFVLGYLLCRFWLASFYLSLERVFLVLSI